MVGKSCRLSIVKSAHSTSECRVWQKALVYQLVKADIPQVSVIFGGACLAVVQIPKNVTRVSP